MKKHFLSYLLLLFCFSSVSGQDSLPPFFEIKTDTLEWQELDSSFWQRIEDKDGKLNFKDISKPPVVHKFYSSTKKLDAAENASNTYWFRYRLKNVMNGEAQVSLNSLSQYDDFYVLGSNKNWQHFLSGSYYDREVKNGLKNADCIPVVLQPGEEMLIYQRTHNKQKGFPPGFAIALVSTRKTIQTYYLDYLHNGTTRYAARELQEMFLEGFLFLSFLMNLFFFRIVRKKEYLYFSLFLFSLGIDRLINVIWIFLKWEHPAMQDYIGYINLSWIFILFFLIQFTRTFFDVKAKFPFWDKILLALPIVAGLFNIYATFFIDPCFYCGQPSFYFTIYSTMMSLTCISIFITFLMNIRVNDNYAKLVITGGTPLMLFWGLANVVILSIHANLNNLSSWMYTFIYSFRSYEIATIVWFVLFFTLILFNQFNHLRKQNAQQVVDKERLEKERETERRELIEQQKIVLEKEVADRTAELKQSIEELKTTQKQLIQSEKMASLGELTAGIAHEIQNPLNFVNNFSELSNELIDEMNTELKKGNQQEAQTIANDIKQNLEKIHHHGKRADAIVKGMLQHSRSSSATKEPTDISKLADEYLRLAYHGLRAKDKSFYATLQTDYDETIGNINIISQDIGRVVLNLINNAFYAVSSRLKDSLVEQVEAGLKYEPIVSVSTKKMNDIIEIKIGDNADGIPSNIIDKIFQPFFTTKPTGQGTGLGLSLSYDIVKAHGGELKVETKESEGTTFIISLPGINA